MAQTQTGTAKKKGKPSTPVQVRFAKYISIKEDTGCHIWTGCTKSAKSKYGAINVGGKRKSSHRLIWEWTFGPIPQGMCVCHNCPGGDNPLCVNPDHLFLDTISGNNIDRHNKGRTHRKLSDDDVKNILCRIYFGDKDKAIAADYNITPPAVRWIRLGKVHMHITEG